MASDKGLKHKPFSSLVRAVRVVGAPAPKLAQAPPARAPLGRVIVRQELDTERGTVITRVIGVPHEHRAPLGARWRDLLGSPVLVEGRDLLVMTDDCETVAAMLRDAGAAEVKIVQRQPPTDLSPRSASSRRCARRASPAATPPSQAGEPGGTLRAQIRRGLRVAVVQKADQETGVLTEGVVREILTSSPEHPRGIKVRLESGVVGRVRRILSR